MSEFTWIARHRALAARRAIGENAFAIFFMGPLIVGGAGWVFQAFLVAAGDAIRGGGDGRGLESASAVAGAVFGALAIARLSNAVRDVYALDPADHYLDALPVHATARLHVVLCSRTLKALPLVLVAVFALYLAAPRGVTLAATAARAGGPLLGCAVALGIVESALALLIVRFRLVGAVRLAVAGAVAIGFAALAAHAFGWAALALAAPAYALAAFGFAAWRVEDREAAREALARARRTGLAFERLADRAFGPRTGAQILRDLRLVRRGFSTTVYAAAGVALVLPAMAAWAVATYELAPERGLQLVEAATVVAAFSLAAITHVLAQYERPRVWLDVTSGVEPSEFPRAKRWTARLLAAPAAVVGAIAVSAAGLPLDIAEVGKLFWLAWAAGTLTGVMCYEAEGRAALGLVFAFIAAVGLSILFVVYPPFWPFWFIAYYYASWNIFERATGLAPGPARAEG